MNCFEWKNFAVDFIDGTLPDSKKAQSEKHVEECDACKVRLLHFQNIHQLVHDKPKQVVPAELRKDPTRYRPQTQSTTESTTTFRTNRKLLDHSPWYVRSSAEAAALGIMTVGIIWGIPQVRNLYDKSLQRRLESVDYSDMNLETKESPAAVTETATGGTPSGMQLPTSEMTALENEIWRFNIKIDNPKEFQHKIVERLKQLPSIENRDQLKGMIAPGGIQIDFLADTDFIQKFKPDLEWISKQLTAAPTTPVNPKSKKPPQQNSLTWFKNKSKTRLPKTKVRIVIWLSQM